MKGRTASEWTFTRLATDIASGRTSSREQVEACLARATLPDGEGRRTFLKLAGEPARAAADSFDKMRKLGASPGPFAGIPVSVKDLFDVAGDVTTAGSVVLQDADPATEDAVAVARLRAAGFIILGRKNMTEFAFSGLGINPHYDTPRNPWERAAERIPGGSSSGAAISVTDGMAFGALGTDTGGSCRIPAALCGIVGQRRQNFINRVTPLVRAHDAMLMPTVPIVAPRLADLLSDEAYTRVNALVLRNSTVVNFIDGCGISIPCHEPGTAPVGLTLFGSNRTDRRLLEIAAAAEICLKGACQPVN